MLHSDLHVLPSVNILTGQTCGKDSLLHQNLNDLHTWSFVLFSFCFHFPRILTIPYMSKKIPTGGFFRRNSIKKNEGDLQVTLKRFHYAAVDKPVRTFFSS